MYSIYVWRLLLEYINPIILRKIVRMCEHSVYQTVFFGLGTRLTKMLQNKLEDLSLRLLDTYVGISLHHSLQQ